MSDSPASVAGKPDGPERRTDERLEVCGNVRIDDTACTLINWSLGGLLFESPDGIFSAGQRYIARVTVDDRFGSVDFVSKIIIVRMNDNKVGARFLALEDESRKMIREYFHARGNAAS